MILTVEDLKNIDSSYGFWSALNSVTYSKIEDMGSQFLLFYYKFNDKTSLIEDIKGVFLISQPTGNDYRNKPRGYTIGYLKAPFDTQNILFYQVLKYCALEPFVKDFFLDCKRQDLEAIEVKRQKTVYNNIFKIYGRDSMLSAVNNYLDNSDSKTIDTVMSICDTIDSHLKVNSNKSLYVDVIDRVVTAIRNPNGGLISETGADLRYLYSGENSDMNKNDANLLEAKEMKRNKFTINEIYTKTNWFYNRFDNKWRKRIEDIEVKVPTLEKKTLFMTSTSSFMSRRQEIYDTITHSPNMPYGKVSQLLADGYDITLGDIIEHPTLFKHYPKLYNMPVFYANSHRIPRNNDNSYAFYYTPEDHYLMLCGNSDHFDLKTVMLHEIQHAIQRIEGFGTGGNVDVIGKMVSSIGGENVKKYFFIRGAVINKIITEATTVGRYNYNEYAKKFNGIKGSFGLSLRKEGAYYEKINTVSGELIALYLQGSTAQRKEISNFLGSEITKDLDIILKFKTDSEIESNRLLGIGYSPQAVEDLFFSTYEALAGEIESRDVQQTAEIDVELKDYLLPMTSESIQEGKIAVIVEGVTEEKLPNNIQGGVEIDKDGKYIIHLYKSLTAIPFLHELGHLVYDIIGKPKIDEVITKNFTKETIEEYVGVEEIFCELFICYLVKQNFSEEFGYDVGEDFKLMSSDIPFIKTELDAIFYPKENKVQDKEFMDRLIFVQKLNELVDNDSVFKAVKTEAEKEQTVKVETPQGTKELYAVGDIVYLPNTPQSDNYGEIVGIKNGVAELEVLDNGGMKRIHLTLDELVKIENPHAEGYEFFYEGSVALGKYLTGGVAEKILAENVGSVVYVAQLRRDILKGFKALRTKSDAIFLLASNRNEIVFTYANNPTVVITLKVDNISDIKIPTKSDSELVLTEAPKQQEQEAPKQQEQEVPKQQAEEEENEQPKYGRRMEFYALFGVEFMTKNSVSAINKLSDYYTQDFKSEAKRLQEEWEAENPSETYGVEQKELHKSEAEIYAKSKITERAIELKMKGVEPVTK